MADDCDHEKMKRDAFTLDTSVDELRRELNRLARLHGWKTVRVFSVKSNSVPSVTLWDLTYVEMPESTPASVCDSVENVMPPMLTAIKAWHAAHPFVRIVFGHVPHVLNAPQPWPVVEWRNMLKAACDAKKEAKEEKQRVEKSKRKQPTKASPAKKKKHKVSAPPTRNVDAFELMALQPTSNGKYFVVRTGKMLTVEVDVHPIGGTITMRIVNPGYEREVRYALNDFPVRNLVKNVVDGGGEYQRVHLLGSMVNAVYSFESTQWFCGQYYILHFDKRSITFAKRGDRHEKMPIMEFAAGQLGLYYETSVTNGASLDVIRTVEDLEAFINSLSTRPLVKALKVLENLDNGIVVPEALFDKLNEAYNESTESNDDLKTRLQICIEKLSKPSPERERASYEAAL